MEGSTDPAEFRECASAGSAFTRPYTYMRRLQLHTRSIPVQRALPLLWRSSAIAWLGFSLTSQTLPNDAEWCGAPLCSFHAEALAPAHRPSADRTDIFYWQSAQDGMSNSPEGSRSGGGGYCSGSDRDSKWASSSNTSLDGGLQRPPPHQSRIRQVGFCPLPALCADGPVSRVNISDDALRSGWALLRRCRMKTP